VVIYEQQCDHVFLIYVFLHTSDSVIWADMAQWFAEQWIGSLVPIVKGTGLHLIQKNIYASDRAIIFQKPTLPTPRSLPTCLLSGELTAPFSRASVPLLLSFNAGLVDVAVDVPCCEPSIRSCMNCAAVTE
jgi:hypothetical protein